jgi:CBS domain-containing protein
MKTAFRSVFAQTAEDVMSRDVRSISQEMSLQAAARILAQEQISGAPVVDAEGRCVGVLSATDFIRWAEKSGKAEKYLAGKAVDFFSEWDVVNVDYLPRDEVRWYMSRDLVTVAPTARLTELARKMLDAHIHRLIVVDAERRPVGLVSSTDILAAVAYAEEPVPEE